jgi:hypothetical protein
MDPFAFLNESINKMPSVGRATLEAIPSYEEAVQTGIDFLPFPLNLLHNNALNKSAVPDVGAPQGFVTPNADAKYYAGENYGYQSPESYKEVFGGYPRSYREIQKAQLAEAAKQQAQEEQKTSEDLILGAQKDGKFYAGKDYGYQSAPSYKVIRGAFPSGYTEEKSRLNTQRQVELENIKAWRDISQTQIEAQTRSAALTASLMTALQQPNVNFMNALSDAFNAGAAPFSARVRTRA